MKPQEKEQLLREYHENFYNNKYYIKKIKHNYKEFKQSLINYDKINDILYYLEKIDIKNKKKILNIGCGNGILERALIEKYQNSNFTIYAIDYDELEVKVANILKGKRNIKYLTANAEKFPFKDDSFDIVISNQVLEHVNNVKKVIQEIYRILKKGGITYHMCPNYRSFYEGHYQVFWLPLLSKKILSFYLRMRRLDNRYLINLLNLTTPKKIKQIFTEVGFTEIEEKFLEKQWIRKISNEECISNPKIKKMVKLIKILKLENFIKFLIKIYPFFHIFHIYAKKNIGGK